MQCDKCGGTGEVPEPEETSVITTRLPKTLHDDLKDNAERENKSLNQLCVDVFRKYVTSLVPAFVAILLFLLSRGAFAQIDLANEVDPFEPIIARCNCVVPEPPGDDVVTEIRLRWLIASEDHDAPAHLVPIDDGSGKANAHIWGQPGWHRLTATSSWLQYQVIRVPDADGNIRELKSFLGWDTETYQHRFQIIGPAPDPPDENNPPTARAGADREAKPGETIELDGSASSDPDGDELGFSWALLTPVGSSARLAREHTATTSFQADIEGKYTARLIVDDGFVSDVDTAIIQVSDIPEGPRWIIWMEESGDRTPGQAAMQVAIRRKTQQRASSQFWVVDDDRPADWVRGYDRYRQQAGQQLPCLFVVDAGSRNVLYLGDVPKTIQDYERLLAEYGG